MYRLSDDKFRKAVKSSCTTAEKEQGRRANSEDVSSRDEAAKAPNYSTVRPQIPSNE